MANVLTIDVEDWFHLLDCPLTDDPNSWLGFEPRIEQNLLSLLDLLDQHRQIGTFFILGWIAEKYPDLVKEIKLRGHELGCHSNRHTLLYKFDRESFRSDTLDAISHIEKATGCVPKIYRAPGFSIKKENLWALDILAEEGFEIDCSLFPTRRSHGGIPGYDKLTPHKFTTRHGRELVILPMNFARFGVNIVYGGGGYFRLLPYFIIKYLFQINSYNMTYFHPRDFDYHQPRLNGLGAVKYFKSYIGLKTSYNKMNKLLNDFDFKSVGKFVNDYHR